MVGMIIIEGITKVAVSIMFCANVIEQIKNSGNRLFFTFVRLALILASISMFLVGVFQIIISLNM